VTTFQRLRRMSGAELRWRVKSGAHTLAERTAARFAAPVWKPDHIREVLSGPAMAAISHRLLRRNDRLGVQDALAAHIAGRGARFVLDPASTSLLRSRVLAQWPDAGQDAVARAERILAGTYDLLGYRGLAAADDKGHINWHRDPVHRRQAPPVFYADVPYLDPRVGDHKVIWELNRHQHWLQLGRAAILTGDPRYAREIGRQFESWLADNPPLVGINWASMLEIGFRTISWVWSLHCLLAVRSPADAETETPWLVDMLVALDRQLTHVERHLSYYFSPNTHLTGEALALYVAGIALPELAASERWAATGRRVLLDEIDRQILADGGHAERSTHYQRYTLDFYLLATLTARIARDEQAARRFEDAASRLASFTRTIADDNGHLPLIGDDDGGMLWPIAGRACNDVRDSLAVAAAAFGRPDLAPCGTTEEVLWIAGPEAAAVAAAPHPLSTRLLPDAGYFVARDEHGGHAVLDVGAHGYRNAGHAHADALSLTLAIDGYPVLIDPGTATYTMDRLLRDRMRSSQSHNTVTVDDRSQSLPAGPFHWRSMADARVVGSRATRALDWIEAAHDGYAPVVHRRTVVRSADAGWLIVDAINGTGRHRATAHWHFDPLWRVTCERDRILCTCDAGRAVWMLHAGGRPELFHGDSATGLGWYAPAYGVLTPTWAVRATAEARTPLTLVTWLGSAASFRSPSLRTTPPENDADAATVIEVRDETRSATFMIRPADSSPARGVCRVGDFETDAVLLHYVEEDGRLRALSIIDGHHCITARDAWLSIAADGPIADLHIAVRGEEIELDSLSPPGELTVHGTGRFAAIRANGRDLPLSSKSTPDTLLIHGSDWGAFFAGNAPGTPARDSGAAFARQ
jgi:uncharacterized heparinase superfamily protein